MINACSFYEGREKEDILGAGFGDVLEDALSAAPSFPLAVDLCLRLAEVVHRPRDGRQPRLPHIVHQPPHAPGRGPPLRAQLLQPLHVYSPSL